MNTSTLNPKYAHQRAYYRRNIAEISEKNRERCHIQYQKKGELLRLNARKKYLYKTELARLSRILLV